MGSAIVISEEIIEVLLFFPGNNTLNHGDKREIKTTKINS